MYKQSELIDLILWSDIPYTYALYSPYFMFKTIHQFQPPVFVVLKRSLDNTESVLLNKSTCTSRRNNRVLQLFEY